MYPFPNERQPSYEGHCSMHASACATSYSNSLNHCPFWHSLLQKQEQAQLAPPAWSSQAALVAPSWASRDKRENQAIILIANWRNKRQRKKLNQHYLTQRWWSRHRWNQRGRWHHARGHRRHRRWPWSHWGQSHGWKWWWDPRRRHLGRRKETHIPMPKAEYTLAQPQTKSQSSSITLQEGKDAGMPSITFL